MEDVILKVEGLSKKFAGVKALDKVSLEINRGEVHGICGENGAGKSTLIKLLSGAVEPTEGKIVFDGTAYSKLSPKISKELGINVIYQEFSLIPYLTVAENIFYGRELKKGFVRDVKRMNEMAQELCKEMSVEISVKKRVCDLGIAQQQIVEIMKAISQESKLIIMDEPTTPLTIKETEIFLRIVEKLKKEGITIVFISHRLEEVFEICDRISILCDGTYVTTKGVHEINKKQLISYMVGRELSDDYPKSKVKPGEVVLKVDNLTNSRLKNVSFELKRGEILGFSGLIGAGRTEMARAIYGLDRIYNGKISVNGNQYIPKSPQFALKAGIGLIPEDRKNQGVILSLSVKENIVYPILDKCSNYTNINNKTVMRYVDQYIKDLNIKTSSSKQLVKNLSGGNQQKVVLAKMLATDCQIIIFDEPTRGIDIGAKHEIYHLMCRLVGEGKSIIMISSDMQELIGISDRIIVMSNGYITAELNREDVSQELLLEKASSML